ncbi:hypothetical protein [Brevibacillus sp. NL20B1]|nr:hypothetical protein [Brevibacillus sp. NL20B1]
MPEKLLDSRNTLSKPSLPDSVCCSQSRSTMTGTVWSGRSGT